MSAGSQYPARWSKLSTRWQPYPVPRLELPLLSAIPQWLTRATLAAWLLVADLILSRFIMMGLTGESLNTIHIMIEKLKSRKLWAAVITAVINIIGSDIGLTPDQLLSITAVASAFIIGQGVADAGKPQT